VSSCKDKVLKNIYFYVINFVSDKFVYFLLPLATGPWSSGTTLHSHCRYGSSILPGSTADGKRILDIRELTLFESRIRITFNSIIMELNPENIVNNKIEKTEAKESKDKSGFFDFIKEYSIISLAIGVVIAQSSTSLVNSIVKGLFTPLIELLVPGTRLNNLVFDIKGASFDVGSIVNASMTFVIVMAILYVVVKKLLKQENYLKKK
jgi:large-conductance mechanosensitive channel